MQPNQLQNALKSLGDAIRETESVLKKMRSEHDPLASHIFVPQREYRNISDTKSGKRSQRTAQASWRTAMEIGFRGSLGEWDRLMGAVAKR